MGAITVRVTANWERWRLSLGNMDTTMAGPAHQAWNEATDALFANSQNIVHVITGRLLSSGHVEVKRPYRGAIAGEIHYDAPYALEEHSRGGTHAFMTRAWEQTAMEFEAALGVAWEEVTQTWK